VHLIADGAAHGPDGALLGIPAKGYALPHLDCAIAFRGDVCGVSLVNALAMAPTYDALRRAAVAVMDRAIRESGRHLLLEVELSAPEHDLGRFTLFGCTDSTRALDHLSGGRGHDGD
jgi:hypothetical protein